MSPKATRANLPYIARYLAVVLALAVQIACGAVAAPDDAATGQGSALDAAMVFCQAGAGQHKNDDAPLHRHVTDAAIVQAGVHAVQHTAILGSSPGLAPPPMLRALRGGVTQARAPPAIFTVFCYPRGPPSLV